MISFDPSGVFFEQHGIDRESFEQLFPRMEELRNEVLKTDLQLYASGDIPEDKLPLDAGFLEMPERILEAYRNDRENSELGRILKTAGRIGEICDRVVVLGIGGSYMGARALMEACCAPYHNELSRAERGGRPRMYFEGNNVDNDWSNGLLSLLKRESDKPWAIVVISKSGGTLETAATFRFFLRELKNAFGEQKLPELVVPVTGEVGKLASLADTIGCQDRFLVPDGVGGRFSIFSPVGLLPAALLGIDVVALLENAAAMNDHFRNSPAGRNVVLDYVAINHLLERKRGCHTRLLTAWSKSLESVGLWYDQLLAESLGKAEQGALPLTVVNTRDLHSRAQQHQEGRRDKIVNNLIVDKWRTDPIPVGESDWNEDQLNEIGDRTLPDIMTAAIEGTNEAYREDLRPTTDIHLPGVNETSIGQLLQMFMLATVVEGRLMGINPYGQPGVEKYKKNMNRLLREPVTT
ncbi:MAG: glucose-6-phosphate isomerase [Planctomycetota bacterium]